MRSVIRVALLLLGAVGVLSQDDTSQHLEHRRQYQYGWPSAQTVTETVTETVSVHQSCAPSTVTISVREPSTAISRTSGLWTGTGSSPSSATSAPYGNGTWSSYPAPGTGTIPLPTDGVSTAPQSSSKTSGLWGTGHPPPPPSSTGVFPNTSTPLVWPTSGWPGNVTGHSSTPASSPHPTVTPLNLTSVSPTHTYHHSSLPLTTGTGSPMGPAPHNGTRTRQPSSSSYATKPPGSYSWPSPPVTLHTGGTSSSLPKPSSSVPYSNITSGTARESTTVVVSPYPSIIHSTTSLPVANSSRTIPHFHTTITETVDTTVISTHTYTPGDSASTIPDLHTTITETVDTTVISTHTYTPSASASSARDFTSVLPTDVTSHATSVTPSSSASSSETTSSDSYSSSKLPLAFSSRPSSSHSSTYTPSFFTSVKPSTSSSSTAYTPPSHGLGSSGGEGGDSYSGGDSSGSKLHQDGHSRGGKGQQRDDEDEYSHSWSYGSRHRAKKIGEK